MPVLEETRQRLSTDTPVSTPQKKRRVPPLAVVTERREPAAWGPSYTEAPDDQKGGLYSDLHIGWHEAPDPIRQSNFYAAGNKIHPTSQMRIVSHLALAKVEAVMEGTFHIGKLLGYMYRPMYAGRQKPSMVRSNIEEAIPQTYGSMYSVKGYPLQQAGVVTAAGFQTPPPDRGTDGDPYW